MLGLGKRKTVEPIELDRSKIWPGERFFAVLRLAAEYLTTHPNLNARKLSPALRRLADGLQPLKKKAS